MHHIFKERYYWVVIAVASGATLGVLSPTLGIALKPLGDGFIGLLKMLIAPIVFCSVVQGIANAGDVQKTGRLGLKAITYFQAVSTLALLFGWLMNHVLHPGAHMHVDRQLLDPHDIKPYITSQHTLGELLAQLIPETFFSAFSGSGNLIQVLLLALMAGHALSRLDSFKTEALGFINGVSQLFFAMMNIVMKLAPIGAGAAMAYTVGKFGWITLLEMSALAISFYLGCLLFIGLVLGSIAYYCGFSLIHFMRYLKVEILTVIGTSSSEAAMAPLMHKLQQLGCPQTVVGLVVPAGYSFNLDGTNIYLMMAALFLAEAMHVPLTLGEELTLLGVAMITSKGATGISGAGFMTLSATLAVIPSIPMEGLALMLGIDRLMSEARAVTNFIGNGIAAMAVAHWDGELDHVRLNETLHQQ